MEENKEDFKVIKKGNFNPNIKITDLKSRKPPVTKYSEEYRDIIDPDYLPENILALPEEQQKAYRVAMEKIRKSFLPKIEEDHDIYKNYTKENIDKYISKYQEMLATGNKIKFFFWTIFMRIFKKNEYLEYEKKRTNNFMRLNELKQMRIHAKG